MNKIWKITAVIALTLCIATATYAIIKSTQVVNNTVTINSYGAALWNIATNTKVDSITWGNLDLSMTESTVDILSDVLVIKNTGSYLEYFEWSATNLPAGVSVTAKMQGLNVNGAEWGDWPQNTLYPNINIPVGSSSAHVQFIISFSPNAALGPQTFQLNFYGTDSAT